jgi:uncharacterized protein YjbI with pentapeptide repeats
MIHGKSVEKLYDSNDMSNSKHLAILKQGVSIWNDWRIANVGVKPDLNRANLRGANLCNYNLNGAKMRWVILRDADLQMADLSSADLTHADLRSANLSNADLNNANLSEADLRGADLSDANIEWTLYDKIAMYPKNQQADESQ